MNSTVQLIGLWTKKKRENFWKYGMREKRLELYYTCQDDIQVAKHVEKDKRKKKISATLVSRNRHIQNISLREGEHQ